MYERTIKALRNWLEDIQGDLSFQEQQMELKVAQLAEIKQKIDDMKAKSKEYTQTLEWLEKANTLQED